MKRHILIAILIFVMIAPFSIASSAPPPQAEDPLRVYWMRPSVEDGDATVALIESQLDEFREAYPDIPVELVVLDWANGPDQIRTDVEAGNPPDIAMLGGRHVPGFVADGLIEPLDQFINREFRDRFVPAIIDEGALYQGRTFGLPVAASTRALFYNLDLFEEAGIDGAPESWEDLLAAGQAINALDGDRAGFGLQGGGGVETNTYFYYFLWGNGGDLYNASQTESSLDSAEAIEALTFVQSLIMEDATQAEPFDEAFDRRRSLEDLFQNNELGMVISGPWFINRLRNENPDLNFGIAPLPFNTAPATYGVADALVMMSTSRQKDNAWLLLEFLYDNDRRLAYVLQEGILPVLTEVAESPEINEDPDFAVFLSLLPDARFEPLHVQSEAITQVVIDAIREVYREEVSPEDALNAASETIDELLTSSSAGW